MGRYETRFASRYIVLNCFLKLRLRYFVLTHVCSTPFADASQVDKWRAEYYQARKEHEQTKASFEQGKINVISELEASVETKEAEIAALKSSLQKLVQGRTCCLQSCEKPNEMVLLELQLEDMKCIQKEMRKEISDAQKERDRQELANFALIASHQEEIAVRI